MIDRCSYEFLEERENRSKCFLLVGSGSQSQSIQIKLISLRKDVQWFSLGYGNLRPQTIINLVIPIGITNQRNGKHGHMDISEVGSGF
jgi:hypothetical protein